MSELKEEKIADKCPKCSDENHEGVFCRCEMRNIAMAKQLRKEGKSPWTRKWQK